MATKTNDTEALKALIALTSALATERDIKSLLAKILEGALDIVDADGGVIYLLDSAKRNLLVEVYAFRDREARSSDFSSIPLFVNESRNSSHPAVHSTFSGNIVSIDDVYQYTGYDFADIYAFDNLTGYRTVSLLCVPLVDHNQMTVGMLQLFNASADDNKRGFVPFSAEQQSIAQSFASQAAVAIENTFLINENQHLIKLLNQSNEKLVKENQRLRKAIEGVHDFSKIIGDSAAIRKTFDLMKKVMQSDATVLVTGETGTGKELIASAIHYNSHRRKAEFVAQNCSALPEDLLESELFGYVKGAFSGATQDKSGLIELADGGTLFLDEVGDMPLNLQAKLLRVIQEKELRPLGGVKSRRVNVRVVAATHKDLKKMVADGEFREDLYYRLAVFPIHLAPLRERTDDLPALINFFLQNFSEKYDKKLAGMSPKALDVLTRYPYPGNIRELRNILERSVLLAEPQAFITPDLLPEEVFDRRRESREQANTNERFEQNGSLKSIVERFEAELIEHKLQSFNWNQTRTAQELEVGRRTLIDKINRYGLRAEV
jgi:sigma-54-dependent transcriptional regulator